jgi:hypothetical protein
MTEVLHDGHRASCLCCQHIEWDRSFPGPPEYFSPAEWDCAKGHWDLDHQGSDLPGILHEAAQGCKDFVSRPPRGVPHAP